MFGNPSEEDIRKIHTEINQLANQRFVLSTFAITLFSVVVAWQLRVKVEKFETLTYVAYSFQTLLAILYFVNFHLLRKCRMLTSYLVISETSQFEIDWIKYRNRFNYFGYTTAQATVYGLLSLLTGLMPWIFSGQYRDSTTEDIFTLILYPILFSLFCIILMLFVHTQRFEDRAARNWESLKEEDDEKKN